MVHANRAAPAAILRLSLRCRINRLACVRNPRRRGVVQVHERPAACASADIPPWGGIVDSVADELTSRDMPGAIQ